MELSEVKSIWQSFDTKLEKSMKLNLHCLEFIQTQKVKSQLNVIVWYRAIELAFHAFAIALLALFLVNNISVCNRVSVSVAIRSSSDGFSM